jgi:hypothetical protein
VVRLVQPDHVEKLGQRERREVKDHVAKLVRLVQQAIEDRREVKDRRAVKE